MDFFFFFNDDMLRLLCSSDSPTGVWARVPWGPHVSEGDSLCSTAFRGCDCLLVLRLESEKVLDWQLKLKRGGRRTLPHGRVNSLSGDTSPRWTPAASARPAHGPWISPARSEQQQTTAETALANKPHANLISLSLLFMATLLVFPVKPMGVQTIQLAVAPALCQRCQATVHLSPFMDVLFLLLLKWLLVLSVCSFVCGRRHSTANGARPLGAHTLSVTWDS